MKPFHEPTTGSGIPVLLVADMILSRRKKAFALVDKDQNIIYWAQELGEVVEILIDKGILAINLQTGKGYYRVTLHPQPQP